MALFVLTEAWEEKDPNHLRQRQSDPINHKAITSTEASKARGRVGFGLTHRKEIFRFLFALREGGGALPASLLEAGASFRHAKHDPKHSNLPAFSITACYSTDGADSGTCHPEKDAS